MTALDNVAFGPEMLGFPDPQKTGREFLALVGLEKFARSYPAQLSGGTDQRQRPGGGHAQRVHRLRAQELAD